MSFYLPLLQAASEAPANPLVQFLPMILIIVAFYFFFIRPQQKKAKKTKEEQSNIKKGDALITIGGLHGIVEKVNETTIVIKCGDALLEFNKSAIGTVLTEEQQKATK